MESYRARWIFPVATEPIENGVITIDDGLIVDVSDASRSHTVDLGHVSIIPGLVNAHTHLEFSDITQPLGPPTPFAAWIRAVVTQRRERVRPTAEILADGIRESLQAGVTYVGEIATNDASLETLNTMRQSGIVFRELIGLLPEQAEEQLSIARSHLEAQMAGAGPHLIRGLSPHAPYSVHWELFSQLVELCSEYRAPLAIHLAETKEELELLESGTGPLRDMLEAFGVWRDGLIPQGSRPLDYLKVLAKLPHSLVIHGNYLSEEEISFLAQNPQMTVVYCPRTHAYFGHSPHPWQEMLSRGVSVAIGTDSRASNPDLSVWSELSHIFKAFPDVDEGILLNLGTLAGARGLGAHESLGSLEAGKRADLCVVGLSSPETEASSSTRLFHAENQPKGTMVAGEWSLDSGS